MRNTKGQFSSTNLEWLPMLLVTLSVCVMAWVLNLYFVNLNQTAEINYLKAYSKSIEMQGLVHWQNSQKEPNLKIAKVTAYSCGGISNEAELMMNCPSLKGGKPRTANGTTPIPYKTMACDKSLLGKEFAIKGVGVVRCTDTGGAIKGEGRFDMYVYTVKEAMEFGTKYVIYEEQ